MLFSISTLKSSSNPEGVSAHDSACVPFPLGAMLIRTTEEKSIARTSCAVLPQLAQFRLYPTYILKGNCSTYRIVLLTWHTVCMCHLLEHFQNKAAITAHLQTWKIELADVQRRAAVHCSLLHCYPVHSSSHAVNSVSIFLRILKKIKRKVGYEA